MPELPEVETIVRALRNGGRDGAPILGQVVREVCLLWKRTLAIPDPTTFSNRLVGQHVVDVSRRGKFILIIFDQDTLLVHLRMSGDIRVEPVIFQDGQSEMPFLSHDRLIIGFQPAASSILSSPQALRMVFNDTRKFGRVWLVADPSQVLENLGPEPLSESFQADHLYKMLHEVKRTIKPLLMDQTFLAGLGNIYTDEALFLSGIHPLRTSDSITNEEARRLWKSIRDVLSEGISRNGASIDWVYRGGDFQTVFKVYQRTGKSCLRCGNEITRIVIGQRSTHYCPTCQPKDASNS